MKKKLYFFIFFVNAFIINSICLIVFDHDAFGVKLLVCALSLVFLFFAFLGFYLLMRYFQRPWLVFLFHLMLDFILVYLFFLVLFSALTFINSGLDNAIHLLLSNIFFAAIATFTSIFAWLPLSIISSTLLIRAH